MNWIAGLVFALVIAVAPSAGAQESDEPSGIEEIAGESSEADQPGTDTADAPSADESNADEPSTDASDSSPVEEEGKTYRFVGLRYRGIVLPQFVLSNWVSNAPTLYINGVGPEASIRKNGTEISLAAWLAFFDMDETALKGESDPPEGWALVSSSLKLFYVSVDILGSKELRPGLSLVYGGGAGLAAVFGSIIRNELTPPLGNPAAPLSQWTKCPAAPVVPDPYCSGDTPPDYSEPNWFNGGSKPVVFPWLALQTGLRYKPHRRFVARLDLGLSLTGLFFGLAANYGL